MNSACASGARAIELAYEKIKLGSADVIVSGGTDSPLSILPWDCFVRMRATTSFFNSEPDKASRPFDKDRSGFVMGEGAGVLVLEELEHARQRGANIYAELLGCGSSNDGHHETRPLLTGEYVAKAMKDALEHSNVQPEQIDYINCHGTSTTFNDSLETLAIKKVFGEHSYKIGLNSSKSLLGHTMGAAGALEAIVTIKTLNTGILHPTKNLEEKDLEPWKKPGLEDVDRDASCDLDYSNEVKQRNVDYVLSNSFGFFGNNCVLCFGKID